MSRVTPILIERDNVNDETVTLTRWFVQNGTVVEVGQLIAEIETSKATVEIHSPASGLLRYTITGQTDVPIGEALGFVLEDSEIESGDATASSNRQNDHGTYKTKEALNLAANSTGDSNRAFPVTSESIRFSYRAAELARANDLRPEMFIGKTLVREKDVKQLLDAAQIEDETLDSAKLSSNSEIGRNGQPALSFKAEHLAARKRTEIRHIATGTRNSIPSSVSVACFTRGLRSALEKRAGLAATLGSIVTFEVSRLLRKYPAFNSIYRSEKICVYDDVNIGFAVDDGRGLKVPVIHDCDKLTLEDVSMRMRSLTVAYLADKLCPQDLNGATFTISDLSAMGVSQFNPLISGDQSAILAIGGEIFIPDSQSGFYQLTLVFDHQTADGRSAALFLNDLKGRLESYERGVAAELDNHLHCTKCLRSVKELQPLGACLLRSVTPEGFVCSICILGY